MFRFHPSKKLSGLAAPAALMVAVMLVWFSPWWIGGKCLAPLDLQNRMMSPWRGDGETRFAKNHIVADGVDQYLVYRLIAERDYRREGRVGWSSLTYGGTAQHANTMALYFDWTMQLHRFFPFWTAWHLGLLGQVLIAALGMYGFLKCRGITPLWASCGGLAYAANSQFVTWIHHRWALGAFCWVPGILLAIDLHRKGSRAAGFAVPVLIALAFLGGTLQHAALVMLAVAAIWLEEAIQLGGRDWKDQALALTRYAWWGLCGAGLAAMMILPCTEAFMTSNRLGLHTGMTANAEHSVYPHGWLQPLFNLAAYPFQIFPSVLGRCDSIDVLKVFKSDLFYICHAGSLPVLLGFLSLRRKECPIAARILISAGLLLPLTPLVRILYQRLFLLFIIGAILAFSHFMTTARRETRKRIASTLLWLGGGTAITWTLLSVILLTQDKQLEALRDRIAEMGGGSSFGFFKSWMIMRADNFIGDLFIWSPQQLLPLLLLGLAVTGLGLTACHSSGRARAGGILLGLAVLGEVTLFASRWVAWCDPKENPLFPETAESRILREKVGRDGRVTTVIHPTAHMALTPFVPNTLAPYGVATISGYDSIVPNGMVLPTETPDDARKLGRCGVTHLVTWHGNPDIPDAWKPVWSGRRMDLYENPLAVPRYATLPDDETKAGFLAGDRVAFLPLKETSGLENSRSIDLPAGSRWLRIAENHAPGWKYRIAGEERWREVTTASDKAMWIAHPAPERPVRIEMIYQPPLVIAGLRVCGVTLALMIASGALATLRRKNRDQQSEPSP